MKASQDNVLLWHADVEGTVYGNSLRASFDLLSAAHRSTQVLKIMCSTSSTQEFYPARGYSSVLADMGHECSM